MAIILDQFEAQTVREHQHEMAEYTRNLLATQLYGHQKSKEDIAALKVHGS